MAVIGMLVVAFLLAIFNTMVLSYLWDWYIVVAFNVPTPKFYVLYGLMLITSFIWRKKTNPEKKLSYTIMESFTTGLVFLGIGWAVQAVFA